jgi:hypothetical protein
VGRGPIRRVMHQRQVTAHHLTLGAARARYIGYSVGVVV